MPSLAEIRAALPQYAEMPDDQFVKALHQNGYGDVPFDTFAKAIGYQPPRGILAETGASLARGGGNLAQILSATAGERGIVAPETAASGVAFGERVQRDYPPSEDVAKGLSAIMDSPDWWSAIYNTVTNPAAVAQMGAQSLATSAPSIVGGIAGVPGGPAGIAAGVGSGSFLVEYGSAVNDAMRKAGVDLTDEKQVAAAFLDPKIMAEARDRGVKGGLAVGLFDAASGAVAGKLVRGAMGAASFAKRATGELGIQGGLGAAGEATKQTVNDGGVTRPGEVAAEFAAEVFPGGIPEIATGAYARRQSPMAAAMEPQLPEQMLPWGQPPALPDQMQPFGTPFTEPKLFEPGPDHVPPPAEWKPWQGSQEPATPTQSEPLPAPEPLIDWKPWQSAEPQPSPMAAAMAQRPERAAGELPLRSGNLDQVSRAMGQRPISPMAAALSGRPIPALVGFPIRVTPVVQTVIPEPTQGPLAAALARNEEIVQANQLGQQLAQQEIEAGARLAEAQIQPPAPAVPQRLTEVGRLMDQISAIEQPKAAKPAPVVATQTPVRETQTPLPPTGGPQTAPTGVGPPVATPTATMPTESIESGWAPTVIDRPASLPETPAAIPGRPLTIADFNAALKADPGLGTNPQFIADMRAALAAAKATQPPAAPKTTKLPTKTPDSVAPVRNSELKAQSVIEPAKPSSRPLADYLASTGGINIADRRETAMEGGQWLIPKAGPLWRKAAKSLDYARERAVEAGYLRSDATVEDLVRALNKDRAAWKAKDPTGRVYAGGESVVGTREADRDAERVAEVEEYSRENGYELTPREMRSIAETMATEGMDVSDAVDRFIENDMASVDAEMVDAGEPEGDAPPLGDERPQAEGVGVTGASGTGGQERTADVVTEEPGAKGLPQLVLPGMEHNAKQAKAARDAAGPKVGRKPANEGLFAPKEDEPVQYAVRRKSSEESAKKIDQMGSPVTLYTGSNAAFDKFDLNYIGTGEGGGISGYGINLSNTKKVAKIYGKNVYEVVVDSDRFLDLGLRANEQTKETLDKLREVRILQGEPDNLPTGWLFDADKKRSPSTRAPTRSEAALLERVGFVGTVNTDLSVASARSGEQDRKVYVLLDPEHAVIVSRNGKPIASSETYAVAPTPTARFARDRRAIVAEATKLAKQINPAVTVEAVDRIFDIDPAAFARSGGAPGMEAVASFDPSRSLIRVALDADVLPLVAHEAFHSIEKMLPERDMRLLREAFPASGSRSQNEEIAYAFQAHVSGKPRGSVTVRGIFSRVREFIKNLGNLLRGRGFRSVESVFEDAIAGKFAPKMQDVDVNGTTVYGVPVGPGGLAIKAYHGSPHRFDKFSMDKIGTGEGAQAYGHGLYFAENKGVAKSYRADAEARYSRASGHLTPKQEFAYDLANQGQSEFDVLQAIARKYDDIGFDEAESLAKDAVSKSNSGALYTTTLDVEPDDLLDWDKPLSEQSPKVREALAPIVEKIKQASSMAAKKLGSDPVGEVIYQQIGGPFAAKALGNKNWGLKSTTSNYLLAAGIPGIRYLDAGSRTDGDGTRNIVMFDDSLIKIDDVQYAVARPDWIFASDPDSVMDRVRAASTGGFYQRSKAWWFSEGITQLVDKFQPVLQLGRRISPDDPGHMHRLVEFAANDSGAIQAVMEAGAPTYNPERMVMELAEGSEGLVPIMTRHLLGKPNSAERQNDAYKAGAYRYATRSKRLKAEGRENLLSDADIAKALDVTPDERKRYDAMWKDYDKHNKQVLDFAVQTGVVKADAAAEWSAYGDYVPFYRVMEDEGELVGPREYYAGINNPDPKIKMLKGGTSKLGDPYENVARNERALISAGRRNIALREIAKTLTKAGEGRFVPMTGDTKNTILLYEDGQKKRFQVDDPSVAASLMALGPQRTNGILRLLQTFAQVYRAGVTLTPTFAIANMLRDIPSAYIQTGANFTAKVNTMTKLADAYKGSTNLSELRAITGYGGTQYSSEGSLFEPSLADIVGTKRSGAFRTWARNTHNALERISQATEWSGRLAIYENLIAKGVSKERAAYEAMNVINFSRHGANDTIRMLTSLVPFLNARIQGLSRMVETQGANFGTAERKKLMKQLFMRGAILSAATLAIFANYSDEDWEKYDEESIAKRAGYHIIYAGDSQITIPKAFEWGTLFSTLPEALIRAINGEHKGELGKIIKHTLVNTFAFNPIPQAILPALETYVNYDMFQGRDLEPQYLSRFLPEERAMPNTSITAQGLSRVIPGDLSPIQVQHLVEGYGGAAAQALLYVFDGAAAAAGLAPEKPTGVFGDGVIGKALDPILGRFFRASDIAPAEMSIQKLYDIKKQADQAYTTARELQRRGETERARQLMEENKVPLMFRKQLEKATDDLATFTKMARQIRYNITMTADEKKTRIDALTNQKNAIARRYMALVNKAAA